MKSKTIKELEKEIKEEKTRIALEKSYFENKQKEKELKNELVKLKHAKLIGIATKLTNSFKGIGRGIGTGIKKIEEQGKIKQPKKNNKVKQKSFLDLINEIP